MSYANIQAQQASLSYIAVFGAAIEVAFVAPTEPCPRLNKYLVCLDDIKFHGKTFQLNHPISVTLYQDDGLWHCEYEACGILSVGYTAVEAAHSLSEEFAVLWDEIAQAPDDSLTPDAQRLKQVMRSLVKAVK